MRKRALLFALLTFSFVQAQNVQNDDIIFFKKEIPNAEIRSIVYKEVHREKLDMVIFLPAKQIFDRAPIMLYIHGGGWGKGDKKGILKPAFRETLNILLNNGIACASIEYRLVKSGISTAYDCVVDCKDAARFLVKHAEEFGLNPDKMGTWGGSAGGHLCLMTALAPDEKFVGDSELRKYAPNFNCVVSYFPATTFLVPEVLVGSNFENPNRFLSFLGGPYNENMTLVRLLSPTEYLKKNSPPIFLIHGDIDQVLNYRNSTYMMDIAKKVGANVELLTVINGLHGFAGENLKPSMVEISQEASEYILQKLVDNKL